MLRRLIVLLAVCAMGIAHLHASCDNYSLTFVRDNQFLALMGPVYAGIPQLHVEHKQVLVASNSSDMLDLLSGAQEDDSHMLGEALEVQCEKEWRNSIRDAMALTRWIPTQKASEKMAKAIEALQRLKIQCDARLAQGSTPQAAASATPSNPASTTTPAAPAMVVTPAPVVAPAPVMTATPAPMAMPAAPVVAPAPTMPAAPAAPGMPS